MTERTTKQFNSYLTRLVTHGARDNFGNVRGRLNRNADEIARLKRCLSYRDDGSALTEALTQAADAYLLVDQLHNLLRTMWNLGYGEHSPELQKLVHEALEAGKGAKFLEQRDKQRDIMLLAEVSALLNTGTSLQEIVEERLTGNWVPLAR